MWFLAAVFVLLVPVALALAGAGDEPDNALVQVQEGEPREDPDDTMAVAR